MALPNFPHFFIDAPRLASNNFLKLVMMLFLGLPQNPSHQDSLKKRNFPLPLNKYSVFYRSC